MTKLELIEYHLKKEKKLKQKNRDLRNNPNHMKMGDNKDFYDKSVRWCRKEIEFHRQALLLLEGLNWNLENLNIVK